MVAWDGNSELGGRGIRRAAVPVLLGAVALAAGWSAVFATGDHQARLPATGADGREAMTPPLAPPWSGARITPSWLRSRRS